MKNFRGKYNISKAVWPNHYCSYRGHILAFSPSVIISMKDKFCPKENNF
jgi:hypothetical protein